MPNIEDFFQKDEHIVLAFVVTEQEIALCATLKDAYNYAHFIEDVSVSRRRRRLARLYAFVDNWFFLRRKRRLKVFTTI